MGKIDAIITWVDGFDSAHVIKRNYYEGNNDVKTIPSAQDITRFSDNGELEFCLLSLLKNASWLNNIYIVTDNQRPIFKSNILLNSKKIKIIDHSVIFESYERYLPTFNSITIESMLHKIPNLSKRYIYLNDDFIILKPVEVEDFFINEKVVLKGGWKKLQRFGKPRLFVSQILNYLLKKIFKINRSMSLLQQMKAAELAGFHKKYFKSPHYPHPQLKVTIDNFYAERPEVLVQNIQYRFRNLDQHVAIFLSNHLEIKKNNAVLQTDDDCLMICFNRDSKKQIKDKISLLLNGNVKYLCIQSFEQASDEHRKSLINILRTNFNLSDEI